ncbi:MAG TPA: DUF3617 family protein [Vicinamibacterales bacterium]|jgi:hypothetical protein
MRFTLAIAAALVPALLAAATSPLKPGEYELTTQFSVPGRPKMPEQTDRHCYTAAQLEELAKVMGGGRGTNQSCKVVDSKTTGSKLTFTTECVRPSGPPVTMVGDVTFTSSESYHAIMTMKAAVDGNGSSPRVAGTFDITGKRIGECKAGR